MSDSGGGQAPKNTGDRPSADEPGAKRRRNEGTPDVTVAQAATAIAPTRAAALGYVDEILGTTETAAPVAEAVEPASLLQAVNDLIGYLKTYDYYLDAEPTIPADPQELRALHDELVTFANAVYFQGTAAQEPGPAQEATGGGAVEAEIAPAVILRSAESQEEILRALTGYLKPVATRGGGARGRSGRGGTGRAADTATAAPGAEGMGGGGAGPDYDWAASRRMILAAAGGFAMAGSRADAREMIGRWNTLRPELAISLGEAGIPPEEPGEAAAPGPAVEAPTPPRSLTIGGRAFLLPEKEGVKGGFHKIYDLPPEVDTGGVRALVRVPDDPRGTQAGMRNRRRVEELGFAVPELFNADPVADGFYIVEYVGGETDIGNENHRAQIERAFRMMTSEGAAFPFDLRIDNIRFKDDQMIVIDFSESGGLGGSPEFRDVSLLEFCWNGRKTPVRDGPRMDDAQTSSALFNALCRRIETCDDPAGRRPSSPSSNPQDYDHAFCDRVLGPPARERDATGRTEDHGD